MQKSYQVGYRGYATIDGKLMLCTGGSLSISQDPIMSGGVWGAGENNVSPIAYAWNYLTVDGSINVEMATAPGYWKAFHNGGSIVLKPNGIGGCTGGGYRTTTSVEASEGSAVTGSVNFKDTGGSISGSGEGGGAPGASTLAGATIVPYWRTGIWEGVDRNSINSLQFPEKVTPSGDSGVISWSVSSNRDVQFLKCCTAESASPLTADYVVMGEITGDCSITYFGIGGIGAKTFHSVKKKMAFVMNFGAEQGDAADPERGKKYGQSLGYAFIPLAIRNSASTSMTTGANYVTSEFSYNAIGDTINCGVTFG